MLVKFAAGHHSFLLNKCSALHHLFNLGSVPGDAYPTQITSQAVEVSGSRGEVNNQAK
jgi:hypothetical protein